MDQRPLCRSEWLAEFRFRG